MAKEAEKISVSLTFDQWVQMLLSLDYMREKWQGQIGSVERLMETSKEPKAWEKDHEYYKERYKSETELMAEITKQMKGQA